ncbi:glycosyltransferase family 4 protein [Noviherbaspirillum sedimenti]|uniref:Glycosyltransferase WbuB n=1 Tax=Noviherbaspirillum sedimenti TaxID=2320865 RepID=A0A3A3G850_9BURK|nr:glycosyltransferase family 4 protein [Noviherbaspirillum sedimenti]RJG02929.1 glycosyltransferase WbuB [Noviherbaspirillum sedimenti]
MKLLVVSQYFWPENFRINNLVSALSAEGVQVEVLTGQPNYPQGRVFDGYRAWKFIKGIFNGVTIHRLPLVPRGSNSALFLILNYLSFVASGILFAPFALRRKKIDVIFVYAPSPILQAIPAILLKWIKRAKLVVSVQDLWPESLEATGFVRNRVLLALVRVLVRWIYRHTDLILVQSKAFVDPVAALADRRKICYFPNSADDVFSTPSACSNCPIEGLEAGFSVVFAGNLGHAQSIETIIDAAALLADAPDIRIYLVGDGSRTVWIQGEIQARNLKNVVMTGRYPSESMPAIMGRASALLATLKDEPIFYHTIPSKIQTYLAAGRPLLACMNGEGARIVMEANAGISCAAEDASSLAKAIKQLSSMSDLERERMGQNGQQYFKKHYDSNMLTRTLISHFEDVLTVRQDQK